jgi:D-alanyl-D-alanine carboxypeptidase (penicillin-binding protein 5/6)
VKAVLALAAFLHLTVAQAAAEDRFPIVAEAYLVKRDGVVIWAGHAHQRLAPASLTKMMTALVALESGRLDEVVTVSRAASRETGSKVGLKAGQQLRVWDLLAAMVIRSANDACRAIADHFGVTFVARMNQRAASLYLRDTQFVDPCGHDRPGQYSTANDLARLADQAMQNPDFARLARTERITIGTLDGRRKFYLTTTNALLGHYEGTIGVKTGTTGRAGNCLVAIAERQGVRVVLVLLNSRNRWYSARGMLDRAFEFRPQT